MNWLLKATSSPIPADRLLVLLYHNVGPPPGRRGLRAHYVSSRRLRSHIRYLRSEGHTFLTADQALNWLDGEEQVSHPTLITFDDGLSNLYQYALPLLREEEVPALLFVVAGHVGGVSSWEPEPRHQHNPLLTWEQLREMQAAGLAIGSHTLTHPHLTELTPEQMIQELRESKRVLEKNLDTPVDFVAYPYGEFNEEIAGTAQEVGYRAAFSTALGLNSHATNLFALRRMNVRRNSYLPLFRRKLRRAAQAAEE